MQPCLYFVSCASVINRTNIVFYTIIVIDKPWNLLYNISDKVSGFSANYCTSYTNCISFDNIQSIAIHILKFYITSTESLSNFLLVFNEMKIYNEFYVIVAPAVAHTTTICWSRMKMHLRTRRPFHSNNTHGAHFQMYFLSNSQFYFFRSQSGWQHRISDFGRDRGWSGRRPEAEAGRQIWGAGHFGVSAFSICAVVTDALGFVETRLGFGALLRSGVLNGQMFA